MEARKKQSSSLASSRSKGRRQQQLEGDWPTCLVERTVEQRQAEIDRTSKIRDKQGRTRQRRGNSVNWSFVRQPRQTTEAGKDEQRLTKAIKANRDEQGRQRQQRLSWSPRVKRWNKQTNSDT